MGGGTLLHQIVDSPGAPVARGLGLQCGALVAFVGSGLGEQRVGIQDARAHHAWALGVTHQRSDVHARTRVALALQVGGALWRCGLALSGAETRFDRYPPWRELELRLGFGVRWRDRGRAAVAVRHALHGDALPQVGVAFGWQLLPRLQPSLQIEREPGLPPHLCTGAVLGDEKRFAALGGFDLATAATSGGIVVGAGPWRFVYGTQSHPDLGWSHAWALEFAR